VKELFCRDRVYRTAILRFCRAESEGEVSLSRSFIQSRCHWGCSMRNFLLGAAAAALVSSGSAALADPPAQLDFGVYHNGDSAPLENVQLYVYGGRNYCWYDAGWEGPGWYWCGYAWRGGYGWGGLYGWNGWRGGHPGGYSWGGGRGRGGYSHGGYGHASYGHASYGHASSGGRGGGHSARSGGGHGGHHR
jgi:hypothetical protein